MEEPVATFDQKIGKASCREFGAAVSMAVLLPTVLTVAFSLMMLMGMLGIGVDFSIEDGITLTTLQVISVAVLRAAGAFI